jgi:hypothetical protein
MHVTCARCLQHVVLPHLMLSIRTSDAKFGRSSLQSKALNGGTAASAKVNKYYSKRLRSPPPKSSDKEGYMPTSQGPSPREPYGWDGGSPGSSVALDMASRQHTGAFGGARRERTPPPPVAPLHGDAVRTLRIASRLVTGGTCCVSSEPWRLCCHRYSPGQS